MSTFQEEKTFTNNEGENKQETFESCTLNSQGTLCMQIRQEKIRWDKLRSLREMC